MLKTLTLTGLLGILLTTGCTWVKPTPGGEGAGTGCGRGLHLQGARYHYRFTGRQDRRHQQKPAKSGERAADTGQEQRIQNRR